MDGWEKFGKYVGVEGVLSIILTGAVTAALFLQFAVPGEIYGLLGIAWGAYFRKNGVNAANSILKPQS